MTQASSFPQGRTAILVIHGIGEQMPYDTLDGFSRGLVDHFRAQGLKINLRHELRERVDGSGLLWRESVVRIMSAGTEGYIDVHEHYWAHLTEQRISTSEVFAWIGQTIKASAAYYKENEELARRYEKDGKLELRMAAMRWLRCFYWLYRILSWLPRWGYLHKLQAWLQKRATPILVGYIGDIAIYSTTDQKSPHYKFREAILGDAEALLVELMQDDEVDRVILAGHSLGSVVAFDTLNRIACRVQLGSGAGLAATKLAGLVTFGSPLDKIAFFFRDRSGKGQEIRQQIVAQRNSFKIRALAATSNQYPLAPPLQPVLDDLPWANFWCEKDPISGHLDFYAICASDNVKLDLPDKWGVAHIGYWDHAPFYAEIARRFLP